MDERHFNFVSYFSTVSALSTVAYLLDPEAPARCTGVLSEPDTARSYPIMLHHWEEPLPNKRVCLLPVSVSSPVLTLPKAKSEGELSILIASHGSTKFDVFNQLIALCHKILYEIV